MDRIVFYVLPMEQFKLTDDLYIKLNARGKVLSSFENFKAWQFGEVEERKLFEDTVLDKFKNKFAQFLVNSANVNKNNTLVR